MNCLSNYKPHSIVLVEAWYVGFKLMSATSQ
ncbi:MAG: hypothetical protein E1N59_702 [Puniceicoccaceae bacterium 5H]|nr:MAG: hypothetical protein E1N59_702 [Puniceicoccaceae bacterium 5H]